MSAAASSARRRLVLMRHAKSDWDAPAAGDHERPLNRRGRLAAVLMGAWLAEQDWSIDAALVSTSLRTRRTWDRVAPQLRSTPPATFHAEIYEAEPAALLRVSRGAPPSAETVIMIGHSPGMEGFAYLLASLDSAKPDRFPTAAVAVFEAEQDVAWADAAYGGFRLTAFETPKTLV